MGLVRGALCRLLAAWRDRDLAYWHDCGYDDQAWEYAERNVDELSGAQRAAYTAGWQESQRDRASAQLGSSGSG
jgi:hypothetical protein